MRLSRCVRCLVLSFGVSGGTSLAVGCQSNLDVGDQDAGATSPDGGTTKNKDSGHGERDSASTPDVSARSDGGSGPDATGGSEAGHPDAHGDQPDAELDGGHAPADGSLDGKASDGGSTGDASGQGPCSVGALRCSPGDIVETCNSNGTAWLYEETCASGCSNGLCTGGCSPETTRCAGSNVETCNAGGTAWTQTSTCTTFCSPLSNACALPPTQITTDTTMDGVVVVDGDFVVYPNATVTSPTGDLTIYATSITVQQGGSIVVSPTGENLLGAGGDGVGCGGGYGGTCPGNYSACGQVFGSSYDSAISPGGPGNLAQDPGPASGGGSPGGGVLSLFAPTIDVAGDLSAIGSKGECAGTGGGSGGGILIAGDSVTVSGTASAAGAPQAGDCTCSEGGVGRVKILSSASTASVTTNAEGAITIGLLPPLPITSTSHPDPTQIYNDNFPSYDFSWSPPFPSVEGYYLLEGATDVSATPGPGNGQLWTSNFASFPNGGESTFFLQLTSVGAGSSVGTVETVFPIAINHTPPTVASSTHPTPGIWYANANPYFTWTFPVLNVVAAYYVFDHYGNTVPDATSTTIPLAQAGLQLSGVADGIWVLHLITQDTRGYFTKVAGNYEVFIGADPGAGSLVGTVVDASSQPVANATVTLNRGIYTTTTNSSGTYNFGSVPAETWEVSASSGASQASQSGTVAPSMVTTTNLQF